MEIPKISLNPLAEFSVASQRKKVSIIKQQKSPNTFKVPWYGKARHRIRECLRNKGDNKILIEALSEIKSDVADTKWQKNNKDASILAIERFIKIRLPRFFSDIDYKSFKPEKKSFRIDGVEIIVSPDIVVKAFVNGKIVIGACKVHIAKSKPFDLKQSRFVSQVIYKYLKSEIAKEGEIVLPQYCFCLDVFGNRIVTAEGESGAIQNELSEMLDEITRLWSEAS